MSDIINLYEQYQALRTDAPTEFGTHLFIQTIGHALGRKSINAIQPRAVRHNSYICLLGKSGVGRKSTAQEDIWGNIIPKDFIGGSGGSPAGFLRKLQENPQRIFPLGEFSKILTNIRSGGYMTEMKEDFNDMFSCPHEFSKTLKNREDSVYIPNPYMSLNTTCTIESFTESINSEMLKGGFLPRWIMVYGESKTKSRQLLPVGVDEIERMFQELTKEMYKHFSEHPVIFELSEPALVYYNKICDKLFSEERFDGFGSFVARYQNYILSYADILLIADELKKHCCEFDNIGDIDACKISRYFKPQGVKRLDSKYVVDVKYIKKAWSIIEPRLEYVLELIGNISEEQIIQKILHVFELKGNKVDRTTAMRYSHLLKTQFDLAITTLIEREEINIEMEESVGKNNKPFKKFWYVYVGGN